LRHFSAGQTVAGIASAGAAVLVWTGLWLACRRLLRWRGRERSTAKSAAKDKRDGSRQMSDWMGDSAQRHSR